MSTAFRPQLGLTRAQLGYPNMSPVVSYDDFEDASTVDFSLTALLAPWIVAGTNAAITATTNIGVTMADGGWLLWTTAAASGDELFAQDNSCCHVFATSTTAPRAMEFQCRVTIDTITTSNQLFGMFATAATTGTTDPIDTQAVGFGFKIASGALQYMYKTSATTVAATAFAGAPTVAAAETMTLRILWDGIDTLRFYKNSTLLGTFVLPAFTATVLGRAFGIDTASAVAKSMKLDYISAITEAPAAGR